MRSVGASPAANYRELRALKFHNALDRSHRGIDDLLAQGSSMLDNLREQRYTLKGLRKKMLDMASTLGMSKTTANP